MGEITGIKSESRNQLSNSLFILLGSPTNPKSSIFSISPDDLFF